MTLSVIGAGFGRTGTLSFKYALEMLGLGPCYHMLEVRENEVHRELWRDAGAGRPTDWRALLAGYKAAVDWPACTFWRELMAAYPEAKVILTLRDSNRWYDSVANTIFASITRENRDDDGAARSPMAREIILERTFQNRFEDRAYAISVYEAHNAEVARAVPAERLLSFRVADGWPPLCDFLGQPVPDAPFPNVNSTEEFRHRVELGENKG